MPSSTHEALVELFRQRPSLAADLLAGPLEVPLPDFHRARLDSADLPALTPTEYLADAVIVLTRADGEPMLAVVIEVQLGNDGDKRWTWPAYLANLRARQRCPVVLLVVCADATSARWCGAPIDLGHPGWVLAPLVLGPDRVPAVTDAGRASRAPELAVLSAIAHGAGPMSKQARALLAVLSARGIDVSEAARMRITECADLAQLETWIRRASTADSVEDLFG